MECDQLSVRKTYTPQNFNSRTHVECDRQAFSGSSCHTLDFNSRTHVECDSQLPDCAVRHRSISTHALTWSATTPDMLFPKLLLFQLTHSRGVRLPPFRSIWAEQIISTHVECDCTLLPMDCRLSPFQLTHSRGVRLDVVVLIVVQLNFNSRTHVECDIPDSMNGLPTGLFQLTHSRGVRRG